MDFCSAASCAPVPHGQISYYSFYMQSCTTTSVNIYIGINREQVMFLPMYLGGGGGGSDNEVIT